MFTLLLAACSSVHHPSTQFLAPTSATADLDVLRSQPVDLEVEVITSARWSVKRSGLLDLSHPNAAHLADEPVPIELPIVRVRHPTAGTFVIDTGIDQAVANGESGPIRGLLKGYLSELEPVVSLSDVVDGEPLAGVLLTHMHLDHVLGLPDVPSDIPVYTGHDEGSARSVMNAFVRPTLKAALGGRPALTQFGPETGAALGGWKGAIDLLGDGAIWALPAPGHTVGSTVYFLNSPTPVLVLGDTSHTCWGWMNEVPPGSFSDHPDEAAETFKALRLWAEHLPDLRVVAGHTRCDG